jgi:hypothetical protein
MRSLKYLVLAIATAVAVPVFAADDMPADNMQILRDKIKADKKLVVAANMGLTEDEAKKFWPIYDAYQGELQTINQRLGNVIMSYADNYSADSLDDAKAQKLIDEALAVEEAEAKLKKDFVPKLSEALPAKKVARYLQIETKIRAIGKYELAAAVPLVE